MTSDEIDELKLALKSDGGASPFGQIKAANLIEIQAMAIEHLQGCIEVAADTLDALGHSLPTLRRAITTTRSMIERMPV